MKLLQPFNVLKLINRNLRVAIIALFIFFTSEFLLSESALIYFIGSGSSDLNNLLEALDYHNFISVFSFIILYLAIKYSDKVSSEEKEKYLISFIIIVFVFNYIFKFYFVERLFSLTAPTLNSLPSSITGFFPFDWYYLREGYTNFQSDYDPGWYRLQFVFVLISAISILASMFFSWKFLHTSKVRPEITKNLSHIKSLTKPTKIRAAVLSIVIIFFIFGIQNIEARDYRSITYEAEFTQDDLVKFQDDLRRANQISSQSAKYDARKTAASKAYSSIANSDERLNDLDLSFWSGDLKELKSGVTEWMVLWEKFLKEMSLQGFVEPATLFDLNQKYTEVGKLGKNRAPELVDSWGIDYWDKEFYQLVS